MAFAKYLKSRITDGTETVKINRQAVQRKSKQNNTVVCASSDGATAIRVRMIRFTIDKGTEVDQSVKRQATGLISDQNAIFRLS